MLILEGTNLNDNLKPTDADYDLTHIINKVDISTHFHCIFFLQVKLTPTNIYLHNKVIC